MLDEVNEQRVCHAAAVAELVYDVLDDFASELAREVTPDAHLLMKHHELLMKVVRYVRFVASRHRRHTAVRYADEQLLEVFHAEIVANRRQID
tara:strand:- start:11154 stop:11432 length:279 start_codon:yes stop_codon:yes gene_type:complete